MPSPVNPRIHQYSAREEKLNSLSHLLGFVLAIIATIVLVIKSTEFVQLLSSIIFGSSMILLFGASTLYHWTRNERLKPLLKRADHIAIYLLIAGTYTPFLLVAIDGWISSAGIVTIWTVAFLGVAFKTIFKHKYPRLAVTTYAVMGWLALLIIVPIYNAVPLTGFILLFLGGLAYSLGIPFYMAKHKQYTHAIWHVFVLLGAACHFFAIYGFVIG